MPNISDEEAIEKLEKGFVQMKCEQDHLFFCRYFFKQRNGEKFLVNWHHHYVCEALQKVIDGEIENLVINVPPGSSKTEIAVINFMARGLVLNRRARFLHLSSGADLVMLNSQTARDIVLSDEFQEMWPMQIADDAKSKQRWNVMRSYKNSLGEVTLRKAGGVYAVALGGQITGFRAGHMKEGFQGAIIIDDPLKADEAFSEAAIRVANRRLLSTVKSRKANPKTPIIVIMQRVSEKDPTGFIKGGNLPGNWSYISVPSLIDDAYVAQLPPHIGRLVVPRERDAKGRFSYWSYKEPLKDLLELEAGMGDDADGNKVSRFVFNSQYQQAPSALGGNIIKGEWFPRRMTPRIVYRKIFADTAQKVKEHNDFSVFQCWGMGDDKKIYLLDQIRGKWEAPDLKRRAVDFWHKHKALDTTHGQLREMIVEDKSSGTGLIQELKRGDAIPVKGIEADKDKLTRLMGVVSFIEVGYVCLPEQAPWVSDFIAECEAFTADDTHAHDDQIDPMCVKL